MLTWYIVPRSIKHYEIITMYNIHMKLIANKKNASLILPYSYVFL